MANKGLRLGISMLAIGGLATEEGCSRDVQPPQPVTCECKMTLPPRPEDPLCLTPEKLLAHGGVLGRAKLINQMLCYALLGEECKTITEEELLKALDRMGDQGESGLKGACESVEQELGECLAKLDKTSEPDAGSGEPDGGSDESEEEPRGKEIKPPKMDSGVLLETDGSFVESAGIEILPPPTDFGVPSEPSKGQEVDHMEKE